MRPRHDRTVEAAALPRQASAHSRAERLIAAGRLSLATAAVLGMALATDGQLEARNAATLATAAYHFYALVVAGIVWFGTYPLPTLPLFTHIADLSMFPILMYYTEGSASPFFVLFVFSLVCAVLRWDWRGVVATGVTAITAYAVLSGVTDTDGAGQELSVVRIVVRIAHLGVATLLLAYVAAHQERLTAELAGLASWPRALPERLEELLEEVAAQAQRVMQASTVVIAWQERTGDVARAISTQGSSNVHTFEVPLRDLVAPTLQRAGFLTRALHGTRTKVVYTEGSKLRRWAGDGISAAIMPLLRDRALVSTPIGARSIEVRLFAAWDRHPTLDDLVVATSLSRLAEARLDQFYIVERLRRADVAEERLRLARDLHDGVLQSLAAAGLEVEVAVRLLADRPHDAVVRLREAQALLAAEQRELRSFIQELRPGAARTSGAEAAERLQALASRLERQSSVAVALDLRDTLSELESEVREQVVHLIHEALVNVGKHSAATGASVIARRVDADVQLTIVDNGTGFPMEGRFTLLDLQAMRTGPVTLTERVASLGGSLVLDTSRTGTRLTMTIPAKARRGSR